MRFDSTLLQTEADKTWKSERSKPSTKVAKAASAKLAKADDDSEDDDVVEVAHEDLKAFLEEEEESDGESESSDSCSDKDAKKMSECFAFIGGLLVVVILLSFLLTVLYRFDIIQTETIKKSAPHKPSTKVAKAASAKAVPMRAVAFSKLGERERPTLLFAQFIV